MKKIGLIVILILTYSGHAFGIDRKLTITIQETKFSNSKDLLVGLELAVNNSDIISFISYYPINRTLKGEDFSEYMKKYLTLRTSISFRFSTSFSKIPFLMLFSDYSLFYTRVKSAVFDHYYKGHGSLISYVDQTSTEKTKREIDSALKHKIKMQLIQEVIVDDKTRLLYFDMTTEDGTPLIPRNVASIEIIDGEPRLTGISTE